jgi:hypothetical protein
VILELMQQKNCAGQLTLIILKRKLSEASKEVVELLQQQADAASQGIAKVMRFLESFFFLLSLSGGGSSNDLWRAPGGGTGPGV